jgi:hypothetical protein
MVRFCLWGAKRCRGELAFATAPRGWWMINLLVLP